MGKRSRSTPVDQSVRSDASSPPHARGPVAAGELNGRGEFFDPAGNLLQLCERDISPAAALAAVGHGALVAHEPCGCGGGGDCRPRWLDRVQRRDLAGGDVPDLDTPTDIPTYIDLWSGVTRGGVTLVFLHGDVHWPGGPRQLIRRPRRKGSR